MRGTEVKKIESFSLTPTLKKPSLSVIVLPPEELLITCMPLTLIVSLRTSPTIVLKFLSWLKRKLDINRNNNM